jgi:hypothetical protein
MKRTCYRCMKDFDPKQEDPTTNFELDLSLWGGFFHHNLNGYLCKECTNKIIDCLYELHAKEDRNADTL